MAIFGNPYVGSAAARLAEINKRWRKGEFINGLDPNFGYETPGSSYEYVFRDRMHGSLFTSPSDVGTADSLTFYSEAALGIVRNVKGILVLHSNLNIVTNGIGNPVNVGGTPGWKTSTFPTSPSLSPNTEYVLMAIPDGGWHFYYDGGDTNQGHTDSSNSYDSPTNPTDAVHNNKKYSIYCTYTAAPIPTIELFQEEGDDFMESKFGASF